MPRMVWMQMLAPRTLRELGADVAHFTNGMVPIASSIPSVVTIHDMSLTMYPRYHPLRRVLLNRPLVDIAARRATAVITVSESAKRDIVRIYELDPRRVHVVHEAAAPAFRPVCDLAELNRVRRRYGLGERVILYVGTIEPRKNLPRLIDAFAARRRAGDLTHQLVCVGRYGWRSRGIGARIERAKVADAITFTGYVPFSDLPALYNLAEMFVFPSLHEGFGLPVVEAMACGVPVIAGRTSSLPEVAGGAVEHIDPLDEDALGEAMVRLARSREHRDHLAALGLAARADLLVGARRARDARRVPPGGEAAGWRRSASSRRRPLPRVPGKYRSRSGRPRHMPRGNRHERHPVRPGVFPALRPEAVGSAAAVRAARRAVRGGRRAGARLPRRPVRRDAGGVAKRSGRRRSTSTGPASR